MYFDLLNKAQHYVEANGNRSNSGCSWQSQEEWMFCVEATNSRWNPVKLNGNRWKSMWKLVEVGVRRWKSMNVGGSKHESSWKLMEEDVSRWKSIEVSERTCRSRRKQVKVGGSRCGSR